MVQHVTAIGQAFVAQLRHHGQALQQIAARVARAPVGGQAVVLALDEEHGRGDAQAVSLPVVVEIDGLRLHGRLADVMPQGIARLRFDAPNGPSTIRNGLDWLLATAAGIELPFVEFHASETGVGPHLRAPIARATAVDALRSLLALRREGLQQPLPFAPYSAWELFAQADLEPGLRKAAARWRGSERSWAEGEGEALRLALRGRDPFSDAASLREFVRLSLAIYGLLLRGEAEPFPEQELAPLPQDEAEDLA